MRAKHVLYALLVLMLVAGAIDAANLDAPQPSLWSALLWAFLSTFLPFYWYRLDSEARRFHRSRWMSVGIVVLTPIVVPIYLLRSRPRGKRLGALLRCLGFGVLMIAAVMLGALAQVLR
jgi:hypothetical protein